MSSEGEANTHLTGSDSTSRLLILDDHPENLRLISELLTDAPVELSFA